MGLKRVHRKGGSVFIFQLRSLGALFGFIWSSKITLKYSQWMYLSYYASVFLCLSLIFTAFIG